MTVPSGMDALAGLWSIGGGEAEALNDITLTGEDPALPSIFRVGTAAQATIGAASLAAAEVWRARTGQRQKVSLSMRDAAVSFRSELYTHVVGKPREEHWADVSGYYKTRDDRWIQLHCQYPHLRAGVLKVLGCDDDKAQVTAAVAKWDGLALETRCREDRLCVALIRSPEEWAEHPQAKAVAGLPVFEIIKIGEAPPEPLPKGGERPLSGVKVLDLTKVLAGPVCGRTLASHGAQVMRIGAKHLPVLVPLAMDTGLGKRSAFVDLREEKERETLREMARTGDVFAQGYRPGTMSGFGLGPEDLAAIRPGIVYVSLSAYGHEGPWKTWRGFDSLTQSASGICHEGMMAAGTGKPHPLPCQALDHGAGYLAAFGAMMALKRRAEEGGSWMVRVSLAQTGRWIDGLGRMDGLHLAKPKEDEIADLIEVHDSPFGKVSHVKSPEIMSETPARWDTGPVPVGHNEAGWV